MLGAEDATNLSQVEALSLAEKDAPGKDDSQPPISAPDNYGILPPETLPNLASEPLAPPTDAQKKPLDPNNVPETEDEWRARFFELLDVDSDKQVFTREKKERFIQELRLLREKQLPAEQQRAAWNHARAYALLRNGDAWDLTTKGDVNKVNPRPVAIVEEYFGIIKEAHERLNHQAIQATHREVRKAYAKVPRWAIEQYCNGCAVCRHKKRRKRTQERVVTTSVMYCNERWHVEYLDFSQKPDGPLKYVVHVMDHHSRFSVLRATKSVDAAAVAEALFDVVGNFGLPLILQGSTREEAKLDVREILAAFSAIAQARGMRQNKILLGKDREPATESVVMGMTMGVEFAMRRWMGEQGSEEWASGLPTVQLALNSQPPEAMKSKPMDVYTTTRRTGVYGLNLSDDVLAQVTTEQELVAQAPGSVSSELPPLPKKSLAPPSIADAEPIVRFNKLSETAVECAKPAEALTAEESGGVVALDTEAKEGGDSGAASASSKRAAEAAAGNDRIRRKVGI